MTGPNPPQVGLELRIVDVKTGQAKMDVGIPKVQEAAGHPVVPMGLKVPVDKLEPGSYRLELRALDSVGNKSPIRAADFMVD
jgi:hypothetical protein